MLQLLGTRKDYQQEPSHLRQKWAPGHKLSKELLTVMCCGNVSSNHKLKLAVIGKAKEEHCSSVPKQTAFMFIIITRKEHEWLVRVFKIGSTGILLQKFGLS
jgi:hypothetical protein